MVRSPSPEDRDAPDAARARVDRKIGAGFSLWTSKTLDNT
jgi:hypothetical protein